MTSTSTGIAATTLATSTVESRVDAAAQRLHNTETALHIARQTGCDEWIAAAGDRLHEAVLEYLAALAARQHGAQR